MTIEVEGLGFIKAKIIADSASYYDQTRLTTFELEYPRFIHSEFMTHRGLSKNAASSRAIPVATMHKHILGKPQGPVSWGKNMPGMQAKELMDGDDLVTAKALWDRSRNDAIATAQAMERLGLHKQIVNRVTEPHMQMKVVCSGTDNAWANFFWLRNHPDAQPEIQELARVMWECYENNTIETLIPGEWHLPYIETGTNGATGNQTFVDNTGRFLTLDEAIKVSVSCCAQVSYRKLDDSLDKALAIYDRLITSVPVHASPTEHQATPIEYEQYAWPDGVTHIDKPGHLWSGNFKSWIQNRQLIPNNVRNSF